MPRNGAGVYSLVNNTWFPPVNGVLATATDWTPFITDVQNALTQSVSSDGQTPMTGPLPMGNNKITGLALGTANTDAASMANLNAVAGQAGGAGDRNLLVNGNFAINQRVYVTATATTVANQVTLDRWRVVTSGQNITFGAAAPDRTVTCPAGGLEQVIEAGWVAGGVYTLSWTGTATAKVNGVAILTGAQTGVLPANTAITIQFASGTVLNAQFEIGTAATPYQRRPPGIELMLCQREYSKSYAQATVPGTATSIGSDQGYASVGGSISAKINFPVSMRIAPTISLWSNNGTANQWVAFTAAGGATSYAATSGFACERNFTAAVTVAGGEVLSTGQWAAATGF